MLTNILEHCKKFIAKNIISVFKPRPLYIPRRTSF